MNAPQPGWYQDPSNTRILRFFDGQQWTSLSHPVPPSGQPTPEMEAAGQQYMSALRGEAPMNTSGFQGQNQSQNQSNQSNQSPYLGQNQTSSYSGVGFVDPDGQKPKTSGLVWTILGVSLVGVIGIGIWSLSTPGESKIVPPSEFSQAYKDLDMGSGFDCEELASEVIALSEVEDPEDAIITDFLDTSMARDKRASFEIPASVDDFAVAFECSGTAVYADGSENRIDYEVSVDGDVGMWAYYDEK